MIGRASTDTLFSAADRERIAAAVAAIEERTRGEVVTAVVESSDPYPGAAWAAATGGALVAALAAALLHFAGGFWGGSSIVWTAIPPAAGAAAGYLLGAFVPALRRRLVPAGLLDRRVELAAAAAFVDHEVFATRDRSGVLVFLSLFEHRVVVLGDSGVNEHVAPGEWDEVVMRVAAGIHRGEPATGLLDALERIGDILDRAGLERRPDDADELPNELRLPPAARPEAGG